MNSIPGSGSVIELRALLREKFPEAHMVHPGAGAASEGRFGLGVGCLDDAGVGPGVLAEVVGHRGGGGLVVSGVLKGAAARGRMVALVDGADCFDPQDAGEDRCRKLLWVRCRSLAEAVKVTDLLARDGNIPVVVLDLQGVRAAELRRLPGSTWFRLRGVAKASGVVLLVMTPEDSVGCADLRVALEGRGTGRVFEQLREDLENGVRGTVTRGGARSAGTGQAAAAKTA